MIKLNDWIQVQTQGHDKFGSWQVLPVLGELKRVFIYCVHPPWILGLFPDKIKKYKKALKKHINNYNGLKRK